MCRLVKGAYWDAEIKRAQEFGLAGYPVFTRKHRTDVSYLACAQALIDAGDVIYPQFATHNATTIAAIQQMARAAGVPFELAQGSNDHVSLRQAGWPEVKRDPSSYYEKYDGGPVVMFDPRMPLLRVPVADYATAHVLAVADVSADEGDTGTTAFEFRVTLAPASTETVRVRYRTDAGSAVAGEDSTDVEGELVFAPGAIEQVVTVEVAGDTELEDDDRRRPSIALLAGILVRDDRLERGGVQERSMRVVWRFRRWSVVRLRCHRIRWCRATGRGR